LDLPLAAISKASNSGQFPRIEGDTGGADGTRTPYRRLRHQ
jgi:hypothetical protein